MSWKKGLALCFAAFLIYLYYVAFYTSVQLSELNLEPDAASPYVGYWKNDCSQNYGLAITRAAGGKYSVTFCGPSSCQEPGTYRPDTTLVGDPQYEIRDADTIGVGTASGFDVNHRCPVPGAGRR